MDASGATVSPDNVPFLGNGFPTLSPAPTLPPFSSSTSSPMIPALSLPSPALELPWGSSQGMLLPPQYGTNPHQPLEFVQTRPSPLPDWSPSKTPRGTSHARKMGPGHIKRPRNAFILFRSHAVAANLVPKEVERDHRNISRIISHMWRSLGKEERALWEAQAEAEKERHRREYPDYKYRPGSRRTNIHRRNVRKLSSTERECEHIADVILKACGRSGVKRRRSSTGLVRRPSAQEQPVGSDVLLPQRPSLRRSFSSNGIVMPPTPVERQAAADARANPPSLLGSGQFDVHPGKLVRRSSSAPPAGCFEMPGAIEGGVSPALAPQQSMGGNTLDWVLDTPLLSEQSSPFSLGISAMAASPLQCSDVQSDVLELCKGPASLVVPEDTAGVERTFQSFSLDTEPKPADDLALPTVSDPSLLLPPVSPRTITPSVQWTSSPSSLGSLPTLFEHGSVAASTGLLQAQPDLCLLAQHDFALPPDGVLPWEYNKHELPVPDYDQSDNWQLAPCGIGS